jgi:predicted AAA+ superfamily ATPase
LILGSASPHLLKQSSESLAGRIEIVTMGGFSLEDVGAPELRRHWLRGGFPLSFLARSNGDSFAWRKNFTLTFLERDLPQLGIGIAATTLLRFWTMLAHYHGQVWNGAELARGMSLSEPTVRHYLDALTDVFMIRQLQPYAANLKKRQVKSPKIYLRDSGLLHELLGVHDERALLLHPKSGASWEGYAMEQAIIALQPDETFFWATHGGAELDLLVFKDGKKLGVECKRMDAPRLTASMQTALNDLTLDHLLVLYPGEKRYALSNAVTVIPLASLAEPISLNALLR